MSQSTENAAAASSASSDMNLRPLSACPPEINLRPESHISDYDECGIRDMKSLRPRFRFDTQEPLGRSATPPIVETEVYKNLSLYLEIEVMKGFPTFIR